MAGAAPAAGVAAVTAVWSVACFALIFYMRDKLGAKQGVLYLPTACVLFVGGFAATAGALVRVYRDPSAPLVSPFSARWFSAGWNSELVFLGVRIDNGLRYGLIINYQITRCILGSLLSNAFQPYVMTLLSQLIAPPKEGAAARGAVDARVAELAAVEDQYQRLERADDGSMAPSTSLSPRRRPVVVSHLILARVFCDVTSFITYLTDLILYVSQVDIFLISAVSTILTNSFSTWLVLRDGGAAGEGAPERRRAARVPERVRALEKLEEPRLQPLGFGGARARLRL
jgi:hypothetical protein